MLPGACAAVIGYGPCGRGVAQTLRALGAHVAVADADPYRRIEAAMEGHYVAGLADVLSRADIVFLATGHRDVLSADDIAALPDGAVIAGVGHYPWELDLRLLGQPATAAGPSQGAASQTVLHQVYIQPDGRRLTVLADMQMINLVAAGGNPIEAMDLGLTLQTRCLAHIAAGDAVAGVQAVPEHIDRAVAEQFSTTLERS